MPKNPKKTALPGVLNRPSNRPCQGIKSSPLGPRPFVQCKDYADPDAVYCAGCKKSPMRQIILKEFLPANWAQVQEMIIANNPEFGVAPKSTERPQAYDPVTPPWEMPLPSGDMDKLGGDKRYQKEQDPREITGVRKTGPFIKEKSVPIEGPPVDLRDLKWYLS